MNIIKMEQAVKIHGKFYLLYPYLVTSNTKNGGFTVQGKEVKPIRFLKFGRVVEKKPIYFFKPLKSILLSATLRILKDFDGDYANFWWKIQNAPVSNDVTTLKADFIVDKKHRLFKPLEKIKNNFQKN